MFAWDNTPAGIDSKVCSGVRKRTDLKVMSSTMPRRFEIRQQVTDGERFVREEKNSTKKILHALLCAQRNGDAADANACQCRRHVYTGDRENPEDRHDDDKHFEHTFAQQHQRFCAALTRDAAPRCERARMRAPIAATSTKLKLQRNNRCKTPIGDPEPQ